MKLVKMAEQEISNVLKKGSDGTGLYRKLIPYCDERKWGELALVPFY